MADRKVAVYATVQIPRVPNFLILSGEGGGESAGKLPLSALSEEELDAIGCAWIEALKERAREQRAQGGLREHLSCPYCVRSIREADLGAHVAVCPCRPQDG